MNHDDELTAYYEELATREPGPELDRKVRQAVAPRPNPFAWMAPLAAGGAAYLVIALTASAPAAETSAPMIRAMQEQRLRSAGLAPQPDARREGKLWRGRRTWPV